MKNHVAAGDLKEVLDAFFCKPPLATWTPNIRSYGSTCSSVDATEIGFRAVAQRQSNNSKPDFTDEEVLTVYLFGIIKKRRTVSEIYDYIAEHFSEWFPELPSYKSYNRRLNRLSAVFAPLVREALAEVNQREGRAVRIADSMPMIRCRL